MHPISNVYHSYLFFFRTFYSSFSSEVMRGFIMVHPEVTNFSQMLHLPDLALHLDILTPYWNVLWNVKWRYHISRDCVVLSWLCCYDSSSFSVSGDLWNTYPHVSSYKFMQCFILIYLLSVTIKYKLLGIKIELERQLLIYV